MTFLIHHISFTFIPKHTLILFQNISSKSAGLSFISASDKSLGMLFYNVGGMDHKEIQSYLLRIGNHLVAAGESWSTSWDDVRDSMELAALAFYDISNVFGSANIDESMPLGELFENVGKELEDISAIRKVQVSIVFHVLMCMQVFSIKARRLDCFI